ncbi:MAG: outer membrane protein assembly factor BamC [Morganella morganii]|uniref:outer membrane protein assembly factor BamC n=1 Tax=Morganella morganii TaxID=582 RepID=UPI003B9E898A
MATLLQKSKVTKLAGLSVVLLLAACSGDQNYKRQVSGDTSYLDAPQLQALNVPQGMILPLQSGQYDIPQVKQDGATGLALDIRPPVQTVSLLAGSRTETAGDVSRLLLENSAENRTLWAQINRVLADRSVPVSQRDEAGGVIVTDWIVWQRADEDLPLQSRQRIKIEPAGSQVAVVVTSEGLKQGENPVTDKTEITRYNNLTLNELVDGLDRMRNAARQETNASQYAAPDVQSGSDKTGLPQIIVRAPFDVVWSRLPVVLESVGMKVGDRTRSTGNIEVTYKGLSSAEWSSLGMDDPSVAEGDYTLQVGDLDNRSSLQFISAKGKPLTQKENDEMVKALEAAFSKSSVK